MNVRKKPSAPHDMYINNWVFPLIVGPLEATGFNNIMGAKYLVIIFSFIGTSREASVCIFNSLRNYLYLNASKDAELKH
jgi:hypothetical protein